MYLLALNCGSSSIKGKLFDLPPAATPADLDVPLNGAATIAVSNIGSKGDKVVIKVSWEAGRGQDVKEEGAEGSTVEREWRHEQRPTLLLERERERQLPG